MSVQVINLLEFRAERDREKFQKAAGELIVYPFTAWLTFWQGYFELRIRTLKAAGL